MGKNARHKKEARNSQLIEERQLIEQRRRQAQSPTIQIFRRLILTIVITIVLFYVGQIINQKLVHAADDSEVTQQ